MEHIVVLSLLKGTVGNSMLEKDKASTHKVNIARVGASNPTNHLHILQSPVLSMHIGHLSCCPPAASSKIPLPHMQTVCRWANTPRGT